jgi:hypothetical protein
MRSTLSLSIGKAVRGARIEYPQPAAPNCTSGPGGTR